jgi:hypothetical protein
LLLAGLLTPGGWALFAFFRFILVFWLVAGLIGLVGAGRHHRRMHHDWQSGDPRYGRRYPPW